MKNAISNRTQFFQPLKTPFENKKSYIIYRWHKDSPLVRTVRLIVGIILIVGVVMSIADFVGDVFDNNLPYVVITILTALITVITSFRDFVKHYEERFTTMLPEPGVYDDVLPQDRDWERWTLQIQGKSEHVFVNRKLNRVLWDDNRPIPLERDTQYERDMTRILQDDDRWNNTYELFLRHNHLDAMHNGRQFYNEKKYGLSAELDPNNPVGRVHKTCYFDSFLLNIIPGRRLMSNRDNTEVANTLDPDLLCYRMENGRKILCETGIRKTANEPGVTTLCLLPGGYIRLWQQNRMAQCSSTLLVASGSGSADWDDCKRFLGDPDGLRKTVVRGMERELWEESNGLRANQMKLFADAVETRITGYFRWLSKNAKSEFVGVSRLVNRSMVGNLAPEKSEVSEGENLPAHSIHELIENLEQRVVYTVDLQNKPPVKAAVARRAVKPAAGKPARTVKTLAVKEKAPATGHCNVSCTMAMIALRDLCRDYCQTKCDEKRCPYRKNPHASGAFSCEKAPYDVLFEGHIPLQTHGRSKR